MQIHIILLCLVQIPRHRDRFRGHLWRGIRWPFDTGEAGELDDCQHRSVDSKWENLCFMFGSKRLMVDG